MRPTANAANNSRRHCRIFMPPSYGGWVDVVSGPRAKIVKELSEADRGAIRETFRDTAFPTVNFLVAQISSGTY